MLRSAAFWIVILLLVGFFVVWILEGIGWAIVFLVMVGIILFVVLSGIAGGKRRGTRYYRDTDGTDEPGSYGSRPPRRKTCRYCGDSGEMRRPLGRRDCPHYDGVGWIYVD